MNMGQDKHVKCDECSATAFLTQQDWRAELRGLKWTTHKEIVFFCSECSARNKSEDAASRKLRAKEIARLAKKGARRSFVGGQVLYVEKEDLTGRRIREGENAPLERVTYLDRTNEARFIMSSRLSIDDELRAVGNFYGGSVQLAEMGHGNSFAQESVDGGKHGAGGGVTPAMIEARQIADIAQRCMKDLPIIRHRVNSKKFKVGEHSKITARQLVDPICVHGFDVTEVAMRFGWWAQRSDTGTRFIPKQQSQKLKAALVDALEAIDEAFQEFGIDAQRIGVVKVR